MKKQETQVFSVFRDGKREPKREQFTEVWIKMINGIEKGKERTNGQK